MYATIQASIQRAQLTSHEKNLLSQFLVLDHDKRAETLQAAEMNSQLSGALVYAMRFVHALLA